ncbi:MAG: hypothetical protein ACREJ2_16760, partial [Planctomycetota bacterium]
AFRVGAGNSECFASLQVAARDLLQAWHFLPRRGAPYLATNGVAIPLFHPERPTVPVSFVKIAEVQNKHTIAGPVEGVGCTPEVDQFERIVVADTPFTALRLAQMGVKGVILAPDPAVLKGLAEWLAAKRLVVTSIRTEKAAALEKALRCLGLDPDVAVLPFRLENATPQRLARLGLSKSAPAAPPAEPITPFHLRDLYQYARLQLETPAGQAALEAVGLQGAVVAGTTQPGFLPVDFRNALPPAMQAVFQGRKMGNCVFLPAFAESDVIVDGMFLPAYKGKVLHSLHAQPQGLIGAKVATSYRMVLITDLPRTYFQLLNTGHHNALFFRGLADVAANAARLRRAGVETARVFCHNDAEEVAGTLQAAGIVCELLTCNPQKLPAPILERPRSLTDGSASGATSANLPKLEFVNHDARLEQATYKSGDATFTVETALEAGKRLEVSLERDGAVHRDRFDLSVDAQRRRFAGSAALQTKLPVDAIEAALILLLDKVRELQAARHGTTGGTLRQEVAIAPEDRQAAEACLRKPDLFEAIMTDLEALGWVGEAHAKGCLYLTALSRKLDRPIWSALRATEGAGKSHGQDLIVALTPPEELMQLSRLSDSALYYQDPSALSHKLVVFDEADALSDEVFVALRVLKTRGALSHSYVQRNHFNGETRAHVIEVRGPVAVITTTAGNLDSQFLSRCMDLAVDESPEQTMRVIEAQKQLRTRVASAGGDDVQAGVVHRHHTLQRLLKPSSVVIPFAGRIEFPATDIRYRRLLEHFLGLIEASALLHQYQRLRHEGAVVADLRDFHLAVRLFAPLLGSATQGLSLRSRELLQALAAEGRTAFRRADVDRLKPDWTRFYYRHALRELLALEYIVKTQVRKGQEAEYRVLSFPAPWEAARTIRLRDDSEGLAAVGGLQKANLTIDTATG